MININSKRFFDTNDYIGKVNNSLIDRLISKKDWKKILIVKIIIENVKIGNSKSENHKGINLSSIYIIKILFKNCWIFNWVQKFL